MARSLTKKARFDVFKRDAFTCQYCGRTPPGVVLEVDHIHAVSKGGTDADHNLVTSCFDCNRGKSDGTLTAPPIDIKKRAELLTEKMAQVKAYDKLLRAQKAYVEEEVEFILITFWKRFDRHLKPTAESSIRGFLEKLPPVEVQEAMDLACLRVNDAEKAFKYFCGVCWRKIKGDR